MTTTCANFGENEFFFFQFYTLLVKQCLYVLPSITMLFSKALGFMCFFVRRMTEVEIISLRFFKFVTHLIMKLALYCLGM